MSKPTGRAVEELGEIVRVALAELVGSSEPPDPRGPPGLSWTEPRPGVFGVTVPGSRKLSTEVTLELGPYGLDLRAFVARAPEENQAGVYRWLLERNLKLYAIRFCLDALGDVYLTAKLAADLIDGAEIDRLLGAVAETADASFNTILELGFASSIAREWAWRRSRGESTANLAAFAHLDPGPPGDKV